MSEPFPGGRVLGAPAGYRFDGGTCFLSRAELTTADAAAGDVALLFVGHLWSRDGDGRRTLTPQWALTARWALETFGFHAATVREGEPVSLTDLEAA